MPIISDARYENFAQEIFKGTTQGLAYERAGFAPNKGNAGRARRRADVIARVAELAAGAAERAEIDKAKVLAELGKIGFSDIRKLFDEGGRLKRIEELDDDTAAFVASVKVVTRPVAGGDKGEVEHVAELKQWDKLSALEKIGKHLGMFSDKFEVSGPDGGPIEVKSDEEVARRLAFLLAKGLKKP